MKNTDMYNDILRSYYDTSFLCHHGILGMKWGVRRFQNKDGTRTAAGKKRYKSEQKDDSAEVAKILSDNGVKEEKSDYGKGYQFIDYSKEVPFGDSGDTIALFQNISGTTTSKTQAEAVVKNMERLEKRAKTMDSDAKKVIVDDLYDEGIKSYREYYERDGVTPPSKESFASTLKLDFVTGHGDDGYQLWYRDESGLYGDGHRLVVEGYKDELDKHASVQG